MPHLYEIARNKVELERLMEYGDMDPQAIVDTLEAVEGELTEKALDVARVSRNLDAVAVAVREAGKAMLDRAARLEKRAESIRQYLLMNMGFAGITKIECPQFVIAIKHNPPAVVIDDEKFVPAEYMTQPDPPAPRPDKAKIRDAIKAGEDVPGCRLVQSDRVDIRE